MARKDINTVTTFGNEIRAQDNFVELYATVYAASANYAATVSAGTIVSGGAVNGASANFTSTCSAAALHSTGAVVGVDGTFSGQVSGASANFTATCSAAVIVSTGSVRGASANFTATCSAAAVVATTINGVTLDTGAFTTYTPTVTAETGTFTSASATGRYKQIGKLIQLQIVVTITTNGTANGSVLATLPATEAARYILIGKETAATGVSLNGITDTTTLVIKKYDGTYPGADGRVLVLSGVYEAA